MKPKKNIFVFVVIMIAFEVAFPEVEYVFPGITTIIRYVEDGIPGYNTGGNYQIGRLDESGVDIRYRTRYEFHFSTIPQDARINSVKISYHINNGTSSSNTAKFVKLPNAYYVPEDQWGKFTSSQTTYASGLSYNSSYWDKTYAQLTADVTAAIHGDERLLGIGFMSENEGTNQTYANVVVDQISVDYTPKVVVTISNSFTGGNVEVDGSIKISPWTSPTSGSSVWYSGDSHTIRAYTQTIESAIYPFPEPGTWTVNGNPRTQTNNNTPISIAPTGNWNCTANFGAPSIQIIVDQRLSNGTSTGSIDHWEGGSNFISYPVPKTFLFEFPSTQTLRGRQDIVSGEKYNNWIIDNDVKNHRAFSITQSSPSSLISNLKQVTGNVTINVNLTGSHTIQFKDPWFVDYADPSYGNNLRNRGSDAVFRTRSTPFCPDYTTTYENGQSYKGVFMDQNLTFNSTKPIYTLKAPQIGQVTSSDIYVFDHWQSPSASVAGFNSSGATSTTNRETPVVFKSANATVTAVYTAVNQIADYRLEVPADETLTIPAGASISFADGFEIVVEGNFIAEGTEFDRIEFTGAGNAAEYDEYACDPDHELLKITGDNSILTLGYLDITNTYGGITLNGNNLNVNIHDMKIEDSNVGILIGESLSNSEILIDGVVFKNNNVAVNAGRRTAETDQETNIYFVRSVFSNNDFNIFVDRWNEEDEYQSIQNYYCYRCDFIGGLTKVMSYGAVKEIRSGSVQYRHGRVL